MPTIVPVGADQDPHIRLTRDISGRMDIIKVKKKWKRPHVFHRR